MKMNKRIEKDETLFQKVSKETKKTESKNQTLTLSKSKSKPKSKSNIQIYILLFKKYEINVRYKFFK